MNKEKWRKFGKVGDVLKINHDCSATICFNGNYGNKDLVTFFQVNVSMHAKVVY